MHDHGTLGNRSLGLKQEIVVLLDISATQKNLAQMAKESENLSKKLRRLKNKEHYSYNQLFDIKAQIAPKADDLQGLIQSTNKAINLFALTLTETFILVTWRAYRRLSPWGSETGERNRGQACWY